VVVYHEEMRISYILAGNPEKKEQLTKTRMGRYYCNSCSVLFSSGLTCYSSTAVEYILGSVSSG
jgi:hypothetical protein